MAKSTGRRRKGGVYRIKRSTMHGDPCMFADGSIVRVEELRAHRWCSCMLMLGGFAEDMSWVGTTTDNPEQKRWMVHMDELEELEDTHD